MTTLLERELLFFYKCGVSFNGEFFDDSFIFELANIFEDGVVGKPSFSNNFLNSK